MLIISGNLPPNVDYEVDTPRIKIIHRDPDAEPLSPTDVTQLIHLPIQFVSAEQELRYLSLENPLLEKAARDVTAQPIDEPPVEGFWMGPRHINEFPSQARVRASDVDKQWEKEKDSICRAQKKLSKSRAAKIEEERASIFAREKKVVEAAEVVDGKRKRSDVDDGERLAKSRKQDSHFDGQSRVERIAISAKISKIRADRVKAAAAQREARVKSRLDRELQVQIEDMMHKDSDLSRKQAENKVAEFTKQRAIDNELRRVEVNKTRRKAGKPEIRPRSEADDLIVAESEKNRSNYEDTMKKVQIEREKRLAVDRASKEEMARAQVRKTTLEREKMLELDRQAAAKRAAAFKVAGEKHRKERERKEAEQQSALQAKAEAETSAKVRKGEMGSESRRKVIHDILKSDLTDAGYRGAELKEAIKAAQVGQSSRSPPKRQSGNTYDVGTPKKDLVLFQSWDTYTDQEHAGFRKILTGLGEVFQFAYMKWDSLHSSQANQQTSDEIEEKRALDIKTSLKVRAEDEHTSVSAILQSLGFSSEDAYVKDVRKNDTDFHGWRDESQDSNRPSDPKARANWDMRMSCTKTVMDGIEALMKKHTGRTQDEVIKLAYGISSLEELLKLCYSSMKEMQGIAENRIFTGEAAATHGRKLKDDKGYREAYQKRQKKVYDHNQEETRRCESNQAMIDEIYGQWELRFELTTRPRTKENHDGEQRMEVYTIV